VDQSLFNPSYEGLGIQEVAPIPGLGFAAGAVLLSGATAWRIRSGTPDLDDPVSANCPRVLPPDGAGVGAP
jgi:hypothetical protein